MDAHPLWILAPLAVFAVAAGVMLWRPITEFHKEVLSRLTGSERFRRSLERIWVSKSRRLPGLPPQRLPDPPGNHCHHFTLAD